MSSPIPPPAILILGAFLLPFLKGKWKEAGLLFFPAALIVNFFFLDEGVYKLPFLSGPQPLLARVDKISLAFGYLFAIVTFLASLFSLKVKDNREHMAGLLYGGCAIGVIFAGDFLSLFLFWESMTVASLFLVFAGGGKGSYKAGIRYLSVHLIGGILLLTGILFNATQLGTLDVGPLDLDNIGSLLILLGFGINCAFPLLHAWLPDAYPRASYSGSVFLSVFTTKTAIYVLLRTFAGEEILLWIGGIMTVFPIFYAIIENNLRRLLSYSLISHLGFMVVGIGIGTELAFNGVVAHAFCHVIYKSLLFMTVGAVLFQTGKEKITNLGGLYKSMPLTCIFSITGAASLSGVPLFCGFISKPMISDAVGSQGLGFLWLTLLFASTSVLLYGGIKIPFFTFFSHDSGLRTTDPPPSMLISMALTAALCIALGVFPQSLYSILPYNLDYQPYTPAHIISQSELLLFSALAFAFLLQKGLYPPALPTINLDADWFYRKGGKLLVHTANRLLFYLKAVGKISLRLLEKLGLFYPVKIVTYFSGLLFSGRELKTFIGKKITKEREFRSAALWVQRPLGATIFWIHFALILFLILFYWKKNL